MLKITGGMSNINADASHKQQGHHDGGAVSRHERVLKSGG